MRTDEINLTVNDLDNCKDLKLLKAVIKIQAGLLKNRDRTIKKSKEELDKAVKDEKEVILKYLYDLADKYYMEGYSDKHDIIYMAAEAIRKRGE